ncbi:AraC family transcriptional regulator SphR [Maricurvus nonylphenolicus]|uniref:AraC family transcriptional regulator n=1 Tax=Maricurvus nonylphenolicus TaxID=1008307 RepID=UPI0036F299CC
MAIPTKQVQRYIHPRWLQRYFENKGVAPALLAEVSDLPLGTFTDEHEPWPLDAYLTLFEWASDYFNEPHLGMKLAENSDAEDFGILGFLTISATTFGDQCELFEKYQRILMQGEVFEFYRQGDRIEVRFCITTGLIDCVAQDVEFSLAVLVNIIRINYQKDWLPLEVHFRHKPITQTNTYSPIFGDNVAFEQATNSFWIEASLWDKASPTANATLLNVLKQQANKLLEELEENTDFLGHVRFLIGSCLGEPQFNIEVLAKELNMSSRTLHRKLAQENTNFKDIKLELTMDVARKALSQEEISIADLAQTLGYSESSAFVRVFKRLQGQSPLQYRKQYRQ